MSPRHDGCWGQLTWDYLSSEWFCDTCGREPDPQPAPPRASDYTQKDIEEQIKEEETLPGSTADYLKGS